ncbi:Dyp-type peroxidase [Acinetobacter qingfengensis]|uniref:Peroxidase n=1 Tax=Acinetobacter qingfengensis TaxID=1262585 RepID=A0A1E7R2V1_9GAMM|nr:Dyp-type peroxidase [Acinetobacter qingfengensis]KAA8733875.1 Dyp-type peroxidase [Acinetobacter qingfengensis]OEY93613.1 peroxidase [Acinetobacter qingfengensis]
MSNIRIQPVTNPPGENAVFIILNINADPAALETVRDFAGGFTALVRSLGKRFPQSHFNAVMGFGSNAWDRLFPNQPKPKELAPFQEIRGEKHVAVATPGDLFFHIRADSQDICFELSAIIHQLLEQVTSAVDETHGFRYLDGRAIIGFVDGTENPESVIAPEYAVIGDEDPQFKYGSYAFIQKYLHNMQKWRELSTEEQEKVIGRRKFNDIELDDDEKPGTAHNNVSKAHDADGNELKILRANVAFAQPSKNEYGTYFIGYSRSFSVTQQMLKNMFTGNEDGFVDRLLDFSTPISGTLFFVPTYDFLDDLGDD